MSALEVLILVALVVWIAVGIGLLAAFVQGFPLLKRLRGSLRSLDRVLDILDRHLEPILHRTGRISDDLKDVTTSLRSDVEALGDTVDRGTRSVERIMDRVEQRTAEIDGLLEMVQEEVEESFLGVASLLRALRSIRKRLGIGTGGEEHE